jgi:hypothetical protein
MPPIMAVRPITPPTTPPAMAPAGERLGPGEGSDGVEVGGSKDVLVSAPEVRNN